MFESALQATRIGNHGSIITELIINPKPDSLLRITMHVKKVNRKINVKEQELPTFNRVGFVAVEWGGVRY